MDFYIFAKTAARRSFFGTGDLADIFFTPTLSGDLIAFFPLRFRSSITKLYFFKMTLISFSAFAAFSRRFNSAFRFAQHFSKLFASQIFVGCHFNVNSILLHSPNGNENTDVLIVFSST